MYNNSFEGMVNGGEDSFFRKNFNKGFDYFYFKVLPKVPNMLVLIFSVFMLYMVGVIIF